MQRAIFCGVLIALSFFTGALLAQPSPPQKPAAITPESDRAALINRFKPLFPALPIDDWSQGGITLSPTVAVTPLGGSNATNVNDILAIGKKQWERKFKNGKSFASCFPNQGKRAAVNYPLFDEKNNQIINIEKALQDCLNSNGEPTLTDRDGLILGALVSYVRSLSVGQKLAVRVSIGAGRERYLAGRQWFSKRIGEQDLACASCHVLQAGKVVNGVGLSPAVGQVMAWPRVEPGGSIRRLHHQFQLCMQRVGAEPFAIDSTPFLELEFFLSSLSNGLTIRPPIPTR